MDVKTKIEELISPILKKRNLHLVELKILGSYRNPVIEVFADSEKGISLGECETVTRLIRDELDMDGFLNNNYRLSVSSPGLDRPLTQDWEFQKNIGQTLKVKYKLADADHQEEGTLLRWNKESIELETGSGAVSIPRETVVTAKIKLKW